MNLDLPLTVIRGEVILVQAIVFNYFEEDLEVNKILIFYSKDLTKSYKKKFLFN